MTDAAHAKKHVKLQHVLKGCATTLQITVHAVICSVMGDLLAHAVITWRVKLQRVRCLSPVHFWRQDGTLWVAYTEAKVDVTQEIEQRAQQAAQAGADHCALGSISCVTSFLASVYSVSFWVVPPRTLYALYFTYKEAMLMS